MLRRLAGGVFLALLVVAIAVTPLNAVIAPSHFELGFRDGLGSGTATLDDDTHLVQALLIGEPGPDWDRASAPPGSRYLTASWLGGCTNPRVAMRFSQLGNRFRLIEHTDGEWCQLLDGHPRSFVLVLYTPIDPATVDVVHE